MNTVKKTILIPYSQEQMYNLVNDIKNYPKYIPWCSSTKIIEENPTFITATIYVEYLKIKTNFTTKNTLKPYSKIELNLISGPFSIFSGFWFFDKVDENSSNITFEINYKFNNIILEKIFGSVFYLLCTNIIDCFIKEADKIYGKKSLS